MRFAHWRAVVFSAALVSATAAAAQEPTAPGPNTVAPPQGAASRLSPYVVREPLFATPDIPPARPARRGGYARAARAHVLGPVAKLRRARFTLSRIKELKAGRTDPTR